MSRMTPCVSIGVPVYNGGRYLREALDSLLSQTYHDLEIIISDNASTDETQAICEAYAARDQRIRYSRNEQNLGAARNYNHVFELAAGQYFKWAAHDDICAPELLERCVEVLDQHPNVNLCYARTVVVDEHGHILNHYADGLALPSPRPSERYRHYLRCFRTHQMCTAVFGLMRTEVLAKTSLIGGYVGSDRILLGELALLGELYEVPDYLHFRRVHAEASTRKYSSRERWAWFDPAKRGKIQHPWSRLLVEYLRSIYVAHIPWREKLACYREVASWSFWANRRLGQEAVEWVKDLLQPLPSFVREPATYTLRYGLKITAAMLQMVSSSFFLIRRLIHRHSR